MKISIEFDDKKIDRLRSADADQSLRRTLIEVVEELSFDRIDDVIEALEELRDAAEEFRVEAEAWVEASPGEEKADAREDTLESLATLIEKIDEAEARSDLPATV